MEHILIKKASLYAHRKKRQEIKGYIFDDQKGYWIREDGLLLIDDHRISKPRTKKADIETGEDLKSE